MLCERPPPKEVLAVGTSNLTCKAAFDGARSPEEVMHMAQWVDKQTLKDALAEFVVRGDERWLKQADSITVESIREIVQGEVDIQALNDDDLAEVIDIIQGN